MSSKEQTPRYETTLNYWMMVERYPNLKEEGGGSIPNCEISSVLDKKKLAKWSIASWAIGVGMSTFCLQKQTNK